MPLLLFPIALAGQSHKRLKQRGDRQKLRLLDLEQAHQTSLAAIPSGAVGLVFRVRCTDQLLGRRRSHVHDENGDHENAVRRDQRQ